MTAKQRRTLQRYCDRVKPLLGLDGWEVEVLTEPPADDRWVALCTTAFGRRYCSIRFNPGLFDGTATEKFIQETLIHELLHACLAHSKFVVRECAGGKKAERRQLEEAYRLAHEYEVDALSIGLAKVFPEFSW